MILGYCTNVHAGRSLTEMVANLDLHAVAVRDHLAATPGNLAPADPLPVGLWFSDRSARELLGGQLGGPAGFRDWLDHRSLRPFTLNGFPAMDFHQPVVKHAVYRPTWLDPARVAYTRDLIQILHALLPPGDEGSISTLPLGWHDDLGPRDGEGYDAAAAHLLTLARELADLEARTGRLIHLDLEPEPGCCIGCVADATRFFTQRLFAQSLPDDLVRRHLRICHDTCHAAVMFEPQDRALQAYRDAGVRVGKVQLSSAIRCDFDALPPDRRRLARQSLHAMAEERYLHQTHLRSPDGESFYDDLPAALASHPEPVGDWRVHYHVPVYLDALGELGTTHDDIHKFLESVTPEDDFTHYEVETYAWNVLPKALQRNTLAEGLADELRWAAGVFYSGY